MSLAELRRWPRRPSRRPATPSRCRPTAGRCSDVGRKLLSLKPLGEQAVSAERQRARRRRRPVGPGLSTSYRALIEQAFTPDWWNSNATLAAPDGRRFSLMEFNFPLFWGLAIQAYEATLVSDQTPADRFFAGDTTALSASAQAGLDVFRGPGRCSTCHLGAGLSDATAANVAATGLTSTDGGRAIDTGFLNIGVRPTASDPGLGGLDPFGNPLSEARRAGATNDKVSGSFKVPQLRNVALTAPYFHNGGQMTLRQVVDFYNRQRRLRQRRAERRARQPRPDRDAEERPRRVPAVAHGPARRDASAPFDHPQLFVPVGRADRRERRGGHRRGRPARSTASCRCRPPARRGGAAAAAVPRPSPGRARRRRRCRAGAPVDGGPRAHRPRAAALVRPRRRRAGARRRRPAGATRCVVPRLTGHTLTGARRMLRRAHCGLGHVTRAAAHGRRLVVRRQVPKAGSRHKAGTRVRLTLQPGPRRARVAAAVSARAAPSARRPRRPAATGRARSRGRRGG